jgi:hypothetical protein
MSDRYDQLETELLTMRRRMRRLTAANVLLGVVVLAFGGAGAAYALAPANSVNSAAIIDRTIGTLDVKVGAFAGQTILDNSMTTKDIKDNSLTGADIAATAIGNAEMADNAVDNSTLASDAVTGAKVLNDSVAGADVDESTLVLTCPTGMSRVGDICYTGWRNQLDFVGALNDCIDERLRLPSVAEARMVSIADAGPSLWTDVWYDDGGVKEGTAVDGTGLWTKDASWLVNYRCVTTAGARP